MKKLAVVGLAVAVVFVAYGVALAIEEFKVPEYESATDINGHVVLLFPPTTLTLEGQPLDADADGTHNSDIFTNFLLAITGAGLLEFKVGTTTALPDGVDAADCAALPTENYSGEEASIANVLFGLGLSRAGSGDSFDTAQVQRYTAVDAFIAAVTQVIGDDACELDP